MPGSILGAVSTSPGRGVEVHTAGQVRAANSVTIFTLPLGICDTPPTRRWGGIWPAAHRVTLQWEGHTIISQYTLKMMAVSDRITHKNKAGEGMRVVERGQFYYKYTYITGIQQNI